jgi:hypothetical protein
VLKKKCSAKLPYLIYRVVLEIVIHLCKEKKAIPVIGREGP